MDATLSHRWPEHLYVEVPCCNRRVRSIAFMQAATLVLHRCCPKCGQRWQLIVEPKRLPNLGYAHILTWTKAGLSPSVLGALSDPAILDAMSRILPPTGL